jgi:hypothetical protein
LINTEGFKYLERVIDHGRAVSNEGMRSLEAKLVNLAGDNKDFSTHFGSEASGAYRARLLGSFDHDDGNAEGCDEKITLDEFIIGRLGPACELTDETAVFFDPIKESAVGAGIQVIDSAPKNS